MIKPEGLEHINQDFLTIKIPLSLILEHQEFYPELKKQMHNNPKASNVYACFLGMVPIQIKKELNETEMKKILKEFKLI